MLRSGAWPLLLVSLVACQPADAPYLDVTSSPRTIDGRGASTTVTVTAFRRPDVPGEGAVRLSSTVGSFTTAATVALDAQGVATAPFTCLTATESGCSGRVSVTAEWNHKGTEVTGEVRVQIGSAAGGSAGGGSAGGGSAAGGSAGGGSAAGGSAGGGSAGGGSAAGGSAAGGSAAGGAADAGSTGGGSSPMSLRSPVIDPNGLVAVGVLRNRTCEGAFAPLDAGTRPFVGVPCNLDANSAFLRPDGGFIYRHPMTGRVMAALADPMGSTSVGWLYPATIENDIDVTPSCAGLPTRFVLKNNGAVVAQCPNGTWREGSTELTALAGEEVIAFAANDTALVVGDGGLRLIASSGATTPVTAPFTPSTKMTRANAQGFLAVRDSPTCSLYQLTLTGTATRLGDFTTRSAIGTVPPACNGRLDANGTLFFGYTTIGGSRIVARPLDPGEMTHAFGLSTMDTVWNFGPSFNLLIPDGNAVVTRP